MVEEQDRGHGDGVDTPDNEDSDFDEFDDDSNDEEEEDIGDGEKNGGSQDNEIHEIYYQVG